MSKRGDRSDLVLIKPDGDQTDEGRGRRKLGEPGNCDAFRLHPCCLGSDSQLRCVWTQTRRGGGIITQCTQEGHAAKVKAAKSLSSVQEGDSW